jgi:uncharacterized protein (TIGR02231 family)
MKTKIILTGLFLLAACFCGSVFAGEIKADSKITGVTVFQDRALVTRVAEIKLDAGQYTVLFDGLPGGLEEESVTAKGEGQATVTLFGARIDTSQLKDSQAPKAKELTDQIKKIEDEKRTLHLQRDALNKKGEFIGSIKAATSEQIGKEIMTKQPTVQEISALADYIETGFDGVYQKTQKLDVEIREKNEELDRLRRELGGIDGFGREKKTVAVDLEAKTGGTFTLEIAYRVSGAMWEPVYEARVLSSNSDVEMASYGVVRQQTGEDWKDVKIILSTAKPAIAGRIPESEPWYLRVYQPPPPVPAARRMEMRAAVKRDKAQSAADAKDVLYDMAPAEEGPVLMKAEVAVAQVSAQGPAVQYVLPKSESVSSDWQPKKLAVATAVFPGKFSYKIVPRLSSYAFLQAKVTNHTGNLYLAGTVQLFLDGAFVGSSSMDLWQAGKEISLSLGVDERIRMERKQLSAKEDVSVLPGLHGRIKTIDYTYQTTIENFTGKAAQVTLEDQIPVSQHDEIKVEQVAYDPKPSEEDKAKPGVERWFFELAPKAKKVFKLSFRVKYPLEFRIEGLN